MSIWLQKSASIQPRTSLLKFDDLAQSKVRYRILHLRFAAGRAAIDCGAVVHGGFVRDSVVRGDPAVRTGSSFDREGGSVRGVRHAGPLEH